LSEISSDKEILYRYINFLKKEKRIKALENLIRSNKAFSKDEVSLLKSDILILKKASPEKILEYIDNSVKNTENQRVKDDLKVKKIFYLEQMEKVDYTELLKILETIKSPKYKTLIKNKKIFYNKKISLYNKK